MDLGSEEKYRCELCDVTLPNNAKSVKQHLKSLTHKKNMQGKVSLFVLCTYYV